MGSAAMAAVTSRCTSARSKPAGAAALARLGRATAEEKRGQEPQPPLPPLLGVRQVGGDAEEESAQVALLDVAGGRAEEAQESVLPEVFGAVAAAGQARQVADDGVLVAIDELGESVPVPLPHERHQLGIARRRIGAGGFRLQEGLDHRHLQKTITSRTPEGSGWRR